MNLYPVVRPLVFALDAERAHRLTVSALKLLPPGQAPRDEALSTRIAGLEFPNPVGLAAGFDKDAEVFGQVLRLGFGFAEVGTLTPRPQAGSPRPRLFRLAEDGAVINRMGFNNKGFEAALPRLRERKQAGIVGVNIGANKDSADRIGDYVQGVRTMAPVADYLTVNISSPNTPGLRGLQDRGALDELLSAVAEARASFTMPIFLKVAPDLDRGEIDAVAAVAIGRGMDALIVSNTTVSRPPLRSRHAAESGGLSGAPLRDLALQRLRDFRSATGSAIPLIGAGGIASGADAYARIRAGASLVQLYSALVYAGPGLAKAICQDLEALLKRDGFADAAQAVGTEPSS